MPVTTIEWIENKIRMIDQTLLPNELVHLEIDDVEVLGEAIKSLRVRGAPAIGVAAAFGMIIGIQNAPEEDKKLFFETLAKTGAYLKSTRPTAVNLAWAVDRLSGVAYKHKEKSVVELKKILFDQAMRIYQEDRQINRKIGEHGNAIIPQNAQIITH
ncbi:MAG: S-methyl-5-thioribose-1-phosphate isomerase, partial [bacterium]